MTPTRWDHDRDIAEFLGSLPQFAFERPDVEASEIASIRAALAPPPYEPPGDVEHRCVPVPVAGGPGGDAIDLHVIVPRAGATAGWLFWIHGGGYVMGSALADFARLAPWNARGFAIVAPEYRLAPEHPFPLPLEDCYAALTTAIDRAAEFGLPPDGLVVGGGSAGGGLAAALVALCRDRGVGPVRHQVLVAPMLDDTTAAPEDARLSIWGDTANRMGWRAYLGADDGAGLDRRYAAMARMPDLTGLPPATIAVGGSDLFCREDIAFAGRLLDAGIPVDLRVYAGMPHGFDSVLPDGSVATRLLDDVLDSVVRSLARATTAR